MKTHLLLAAGLLATVSAVAADAGFKPLFNGKDLTGWNGNPKLWSVKDGTIQGQTTAENPTKGNTFLIYTNGEVADFELRFSYKIDGGNSGVQYRSKVIDEAKFVCSGYQADIDSTPRYSGMNYEEKARTILAERGQKVTIGADGKREIEKFGDPAELQAKIKNEDWNDYRIVAKGNHLEHYINGVLMSEVIDNQKDKAATSGVLALQAHQGPPMTVQFKELRIKELK